MSIGLLAAVSPAGTSRACQDAVVREVADDRRRRERRTAPSWTGYCEPEIGCESVWPSTTTGWLRSSRTIAADLVDQAACASGLQRRVAGGEEDLVGEQLDDQAAAADGDVDLALQAGVLGEVVDPALERAEVLLLLLGLLGLLGGVLRRSCC